MTLKHDWQFFLGCQRDKPRDVQLLKLILLNMLTILDYDMYYMPFVLSFDISYVSNKFCFFPFSWNHIILHLLFHESNLFYWVFIGYVINSLRHNNCRTHYTTLHITHYTLHNILIKLFINELVDSTIALPVLYQIFYRNISYEIINVLLMDSWLSSIYL